jgi:putative FmdB family regulatory protein
MPPLYSYTCEDCDRTKQEMRLMKERDQKPLPVCDRCKEEMKFIISGPPMGIVKNPAVPRGGF